jgi:hypothetical protein
LHIFKELEQFEEEAEMIDDERSPSPSLRPDHPMNKPSFFKKDIIGVTSRKPKTLASVLEKKSRVQENLGLSKTERRSKLVAPKVHVKKDLDDTGSDTSAKNSEVKKTSGISRIQPKLVKRPSKAVKLAKFDLIDGNANTSRTKTPQKSSTKNHFLTPTSSRSDAKAR